MNRAKLRFKVGDRVLALTEDGWTEAFVRELWTQEDRGLATYQMRTVESQNDIYTIVDSPASVRNYVDHGLPRVVLSVQCGDGWEDTSDLIRKYSIDTRIVGPQLLLQAASAGNVEVVEGLIDEHEVPEGTCDKDGRNILHLALMNKQFDLVDTISSSYQKLLVRADNKGFNAIHYVVMSKDTDLLWNILYDQKFEEHQTYTLLNLVDIHGQHHSDKSQEKITSIISPLDWARRTKQPEMEQILEQYINEQKVCRQLMDIGLRCDDKETDESLLQKLTKLKALIDELGLDMEDLFDLWEMHRYMALVIRVGSSQGHIRSIRYAIDTFLPPQRASNPTRFAGIVREAIAETVTGASKSRFPSSHANSEYKISDNPKGWAMQLNLLYDVDYAEWRGARWQEFLHKNLVKAQERSKEKGYGRGEWADVLVSYLECTISKQKGVLVAERVVVLDYLLSLQTAMHTLVLPLHTIVQHGQLQLLQWAAREGHVKLQDPVTSCPHLVEHVSTRTWLTLERKIKKTGKRAIPGDLTIGEALCALAVGGTEIPLVRWLLKEVIAPARRGVTFNGKDLMYVATAQDTLAMVRLLGELLPASQVFECIVEANEKNQYRVGKALLELFPSTQPTSERVDALIAVGLGSRNHLLREWARDEDARNVTVQLMELLELNAPLEELISSFERFDVRVEGWYWEELGFFTHTGFQKELFDYYTDTKTVRDKERMFSCIVVAATRLDNSPFLEHVVSAMWASVEAAELSKDSEYMDWEDRIKFIALIRDYAKFAAFEGKPAIEQWLIRAAETYEKSIVSKKVKKKDGAKNPFWEFADLVDRGAPVEEFEACIERQKEAAQEMTEKELRDEFISMEYLARNLHNVYKRFATGGHLHLIKWLLETKGFKPCYQHVEEAIIEAGRAAHVDVVQYFLEEVYNPRWESLRMVPVGESSDEDEKEPEHADFRARAAYKVAEFVFQVALNYSYQEEDLLGSKEPLAQILQCLFSFALEHQLYTDDNLMDSSKLVLETVKALQARSHPDMWSLVERMLSVKLFREVLNCSNLLNEVAEETFSERMSLARRCLNSAASENALHYEHSVRVLMYLLDHGARPGQLVDFVITKGASIYKMSDMPRLLLIVQGMFERGIDIQRVNYVKFSDTAGGKDREEMKKQSRSWTSRKRRRDAAGPSPTPPWRVALSIS